MLRTTLRSLFAHKFRLASTVVAVMLGVAFMAGSFVFTNTLDASLAATSADAEKDTDAFVRGEATLDTGYGTAYESLDVSLATRIEKVAGVEAVTPRVEGYAQIVGADGKPIDTLDSGARPAGMAWGQVPALNPFRLSEGRGPRAPNEVVIDAATARDAKLQVGDTTGVLTKDQPRLVTVVGIARFGEADSIAGASAVLFTPETAARLLGTPGKVDGFAVDAAPGVSEQELVSALEPVLPQGSEAVTGTTLAVENAGRSNEDVRFFTIFMTAFGVVALVVGAFIINNTFAILVAQRTRELALLRALGASRRQVRLSVTLEAVVVGALASGLGLLGGVGVAYALRSLMTGFGVDMPDGPLVVRPSSLAIAFAAGLLITVLSALIPARRASRTAPMAALRDVAYDHGTGMRRRLLVGLLVSAAGAAALVGGIAGGTVPLVGVGGLGTFAGAVVLGPVMARPVTRLLGAPLPRLFGVRGRLARENAARNPRRTAATAAALMVGVGLVGSMTAFAASGKHSVISSFEREFQGDFVVESGAWMYGGFSAALTRDVAGLPEVQSVASRRLVKAEVGGNVTDLAAWQPSTVQSVFDLGVESGSVAALGGDGIAMSDDWAEEKGFALGDTMTVTFANGSSRDFTVKAIYAHYDWVGSVWVSQRALDVLTPDALDTSIYVKAAPGATQEAVRAALDDVSSSYPTHEVLSRAGLRKTVEQGFDTMLGLVYGLLALAIVIALLGIATTVGLSVVERTRELGLLRAVGMSRAHLRGMVRQEAAVIAVFGTLTGLAVGMFLGWAMVFAVSQAVDTATFVVPYWQLAEIVAVAAVAGVLAAVLPARRAGRMDVLLAIAAE